MTTTLQAPEDRYVPFAGPKGWGAAAFIVLLAGALYFGAYSIHKATFQPPTDPTNLDGVTVRQ
jgi:hypothetical protein